MTELGLFDLLSPVLAFIDGFMRETLTIPAIGRIAIFAAFGSFASMLLFKKVSDQTGLATLKQDIKAVQKELSNPGIESAELRKVISKNMKLSGRQLWLSFWPALLASIPVLFLLAFGSNQFSLESPKSDFRYYVTPVGLQISPMEFKWTGVNAQWDARKKAWTFYAPGPGMNALLVLGDQKQLSLPRPVPTSVIHARRWWNHLLANPAGYLEADVNIEMFQLNTPTQVIIDWGPGWMRGWVFAFMLFLILFSIVIKVVFKIQ